MIEHFIFISFLLIFCFSAVGYGYLFSKIFFKDFQALNIGYQGIIGIFSISIISVLTSFFSSHNYIHNFFLHLIGLISYLQFLIWNKKVVVTETKKLIIITIILLIGIYVFKNHDDFPYYHLTYALNLSENKLILGTGIFSHGFKTFSSLFYYHSTLYFPVIKYYLFHSAPFLILVFFDFIILDKIKKKFDKSEFDIVYFFSLLSFIFINIAFYRLSEHGTDRSGQILLFLIFLIFFEFVFYNKEFKKKNILFNLMSVIILFIASIKAYFYIYFLVIPLFFFKNKFYSFYFVKKNLKIIFFLVFAFIINLTPNYLSTGCFIFPIEKTCLVEQSWSLEKEEVKRLRTHYEWWAKAGGGPNYASEKEPEDYIKGFGWVENWIDRHFFNKVSDTALGVIFISLITYLLFRNSGKKFKKKRHTLSINLVLLLIFLEWFFNHPSMRYGGYILISLPIFIFVSKEIEKFNNSKRKVMISTILLIFITLFSYNLRNLNRINYEVKNYDYQIFKSPFFKVENVKTEISFESKDFKIYKPINNMCWASPTPCAYRSGFIVEDFFGYKVVKKEKK